MTCGGGSGSQQRTCQGGSDDDGDGDGDGDGDSGGGTCETTQPCTNTQPCNYSIYYFYLMRVSFCMKDR